MELKALSATYRRTTEGGLRRTLDINIQRPLNDKRCDEIRQFVHHGPWASLRKKQQESEEYKDLIMPGWLPTAIVVNILTSVDEKWGKKVVNDELIQVEASDVEQKAIIRLPKGFTGNNWKPKSLPPIEIIDGQHRLGAFDDDNLDGDFELPVVAFHGLDISWRAYLFWAINIKPKRINQSLAYDLYPLLRKEEWLEKFEGHSIYRETRAQELTEAMWAHPESPWFQRINMIGEIGKGTMVKQAAWIRSLLATYLKKRYKGIGGLFGASVGSKEEVLPWSRAQQAAFLILAGSFIRDEIKSYRVEWTEDLRKAETMSDQRDPAFAGSHTLLNTDQGIRGILYVTNDLCFVQADQLRLHEWEPTAGGDSEDAIDESAINDELASLGKLKVAEFLRLMAKKMTEFDWRSSSAPGLSSDMERRRRQGAYRGSSGYNLLREDLLRHIAKDTREVGLASKRVLALLGYH